MQKYKNTNLQIDDNLGLLTVDRQKENNALDIQTSKEIYEGLNELEQNPSIKGILILGNDRLF